MQDPASTSAGRGLFGVNNDAKAASVDRFNLQHLHRAITLIEELQKHHDGGDGDYHQPAFQTIHP